MNQKQAQMDIEYGNKYPYASIESMDWSHQAARGIISNLMDRRGVKRGFENIDEDVKREIVNNMATIIRTARLEVE